VLALDWKGERGWGYGHVCLNMQVRGELAWVVAEALALEWKGRRGWGYSHVCPNMQVRGAGVGIGMERG